MTAHPLDNLYGTGTAAAFAAHVGLTAIVPGSQAAITEVLTGNGSVHVEVAWTSAKGLSIGLYKLDYWPTRVHCSLMELQLAYQAKGVNTLLMSRLAPWWPTLGLQTHTIGMAQPGSDLEKALLFVGYHRLPDGEFGTRLTNDRGHEYLAWVKAGSTPAQEPAWRKALGPAPPEVL